VSEAPRGEERINAAERHERLAADERAQRLIGTVHGTIVSASVLAVSGGVSSTLEAAEAGLYVLATVVVFWIAHGWGHALGFRAAGMPEHGFFKCLRDQLPILESVIPPLVAMGLAEAFGASADAAIDFAIWVCVGQLGLLGVGVARREGLPPHRVLTTALGCAGLGLVMVALKAIVH
jgi:hypothetical protein